MKQNKKSSETQIHQSRGADLRKKSEESKSYGEKARAEKSGADELETPVHHSAQTSPKNQDIKFQGGKK